MKTFWGNIIPQVKLSDYFCVFYSVQIFFFVSYFSLVGLKEFGQSFKADASNGKIMHSCHLKVLLLVFWFQSIHCNQNAVLDKNYSDRLMKPSNQQLSLQQVNEATHHATVSVQATEQTPHHTSNVNRLKRTFVCSFFGCSQNYISWKFCLIWTEFIKSKDHNIRILFCFCFQTLTIGIAGS